MTIFNYFLTIIFILILCFNFLAKILGEKNVDNTIDNSIDNTTAILIDNNTTNSVDNTTDNLINNINHDPIPNTNTNTNLINNTDDNLTNNNNSTSNNSTNNNSTELIPTRIIVKIKDAKYDITDFLRKHPGGKNILIENNGKDIEDLMKQNEHSEIAYKILNRYKI